MIEELVESIQESPGMVGAVLVMWLIVVAMVWKMEMWDTMSIGTKILVTIVSLPCFLIAGSIMYRRD